MLSRRRSLFKILTKLDFLQAFDGSAGIASNHSCIVERAVAGARDLHAGIGGALHRGIGQYVDRERSVCRRDVAVRIVSRAGHLPPGPGFGGAQSASAVEPLMPISVSAVASMRSRPLRGAERDCSDNRSREGRLCVSFRGNVECCFPSIRLAAS